MFGMPLYINPIWWLIALAGLVAWARAVTWISRDVHDVLREQSELMWRLIGLGSLLVIVGVWLVMPWGILALVANLLIVAGVVGGYWYVRVKELGPRGHLFRGAIQGVESARRGAQDRRAARQVVLQYLRKDDTPMPLPRPDDPSAAGLADADAILLEALKRHAEGIELSPSEAGYELRYIIDGVPFAQPTLARPTAEPVIQAIKMVAGLAIEERRRPQEGMVRVREAAGAVTRWTVRTSGSTAGEKVSLSANEHLRWHQTVDQLGFTAEQLTQVRQLVDFQKLQGVVIVATPRGTGRTTTLYSLVRTHDAFTTAVFTIETNPQTEIEGATVVRFDPRAANANYAKTLASTFLKDPGVVLSAQCPDSASAEALAQFTLEDKRAYVGMPADNTLAALELWMQLVRDKKLAVESLRGIISQRLVRILCPTCKIPYQPDEATLRKLNLPVGRNLQSFKHNTEGITDQKGNRHPCPDCNSIGYRGRTGIFEVMVITPEMREAIIKGASAKQVQAMARKNNMLLLVEAGIRKFAVGLTSINEVLRVVQGEKSPPPQASPVMQPQ